MSRRNSGNVGLVGGDKPGLEGRFVGGHGQVAEDATASVVDYGENDRLGWLRNGSKASDIVKNAQVSRIHCDWTRTCLCLSQAGGNQAVNSIHAPIA